MSQSKPAYQNPKERLGNTREVSLGFTKKLSTDEARRCPQCAEPVCMPGCPLDVDIPGFIRFLREGDAVSALEKIKNDNPFPAICGRICPAPCEKVCVFHEEGSAISIRALERYAADNGKAKHGAKLKLTVSPTGKKVAIVGSGPSAMAAASMLLRAGVAVTMFEAADEPGGALRYGIPEFRLPNDVLEEQFEELQSQGLELQTNILIGRMKSLEELVKTFDAVLIATGASIPIFSGIEGENLGGVYYAQEFLMRLHSVSKDNVLASAQSLFNGTQTVVVGGGYAALDAARMAARLGQQVSLIHGSFEEEIGVSQEDLKQALDEGIDIQTPIEVLQIRGNAEELVQGLEIRRLEIVEENDKLSLKPMPEEPTIFPAQTVILSNGHRSNSFLATVTPQLKVNADGTLWSDQKRSMTSIDKVFAVAGVVSSSLTVLEAFSSGKAVAHQIKEYLKP